MIIRSTNVKAALRSRQKGYVINPFGSGGVETFHPIPPTNLKLWIDPSDASSRVMSGVNIENITCKISGKVFTKGGTNVPIINQAGGLFPLASMDFGTSGTSWLYNNPGVTVTFPLTIFAVVYWRNRSSQYSALSLLNGTNASVYQYTAVPNYFTVYTASNGGGNLQVLGQSGNNFFYEATGSIAKNSRALTEAHWGTSSADSSLWVNGIQKAQTSTGAAYNTNPVFNQIGGPDTLYVPNGAFGEIMIYQGALSTIDAETVRSYLKNKWGTP